MELSTTPTLCSRLSTALPVSSAENLIYFTLSADIVDVYDARDAIEACGGLWGDERESCYAIFGVDPEAEVWYDLVFKLEQVLEMDTCKSYYWLFL